MKTFKTKGYLASHIRRVHSDSEKATAVTNSQQKTTVSTNPACHCPVCSRSFYKKRELTSHLVTHNTDEGPFECEIYTRTFRSDYHLKADVKINIVHSKADVGKDRPFQCPDCPKNFRLKGMLKAHSILVHGRGETPNQCHICSKSFLCPSALKTHTLIHTGERPFLCKICPNAYMDLPRLKLHMLSHADELPFKCSVCSKGFKVASLLRTHMFIHSGELGYKCTICCDGFTTSYALKLHQEMHKRMDLKEENASNTTNMTTQNEHECHICLKPFRTRGILVSHIRPVP
ncbi:MAG: hypothetical protein GY696_13950 [Gammaproteobacteria bacterium]|nr:hypothetical protein [Gammaproteobacteria bacterium]